MCLSEHETEMLASLYDYSRTPLWIFNQSMELQQCFFPQLSCGLKSAVTAHINGLAANISHPDFDILCYENELYDIFGFVRDGKTFYLLSGPMFLSGFYHTTEMRTLSFAGSLSSTELKLLVENLPVVTLGSFSSLLRVLMLFLKGGAPQAAEIARYKFSNLQGSLNRTFTHELFENTEDYRIHTPYSQELSVLNCVKEGDTARLEATYRALPQTKYGNMSANPLRLLFYGCIANTTLITRFAIEGGLEEETAFTLSDVYIKQMERCSTFYELNLLNEKMAMDFTQRVAQEKASKNVAFIRPISICINYIEKNIHQKITLEILAERVNLTPKYLSCLFRKETGMTVSAFIEDKKIEKAKDLLMNSQYSSSEISDHLSFNSQSYFIAVFKRKTGMTPKEYRNRYAAANGVDKDAGVPLE